MKIFPVNSVKSAKRWMGTETLLEGDVVVGDVVVGDRHCHLTLTFAPAVTQCDFISLICSVIIESITRSILCTGEQVKYTRTSPNTPLVALAIS